MAAHTRFTAVSLCTGIGGLDHGLNIALGGKMLPVLYVEREAFCVANLAWQMEKKFMVEAPIWSDVRTVTSPECRDYIRTALGGKELDFIFGGIPCQPFSAAGKRLGRNDERDLWPATLKAIAFYEPRFVFIENVGGMASHVDGARRLISDLEGLGYSVKAGFFSSKECGANHERRRLFFLGIADRIRLADAECERQKKWGGKCKDIEEKFSAIKRDSLQLADTSKSIEREQNNGISIETDTRRDINRNFLYAPARNDFATWAIVAEMDATRMPTVESTLRGVADGLANWDLQLHAIGNGCDPLVAAYAFCTLWACMS